MKIGIQYIEPWFKTAAFQTFVRRYPLYEKPILGRMLFRDLSNKIRKIKIKML